MKETIDKIMTWIKGNLLLAIGAGILLAILLFPRIIRKLLGTNYRHRRRNIPRSVGMRKTRRRYTKGGKAKKPWQIKGSLAAKRHMARLRKRR